MSKIICDVCGTSYPETATQCPICGCVRSSDSVTIAGDTSEASVQAPSAYTYVKGGRFSKTNVKKRNSGKPIYSAETPNRPNRNAAPKQDDKKPKKNEIGLIIAVVVLLIAIAAVVIYIACSVLNIDVPKSGGQDKNISNSTAGTLESGETTEPSAPIVPCEKLEILSESVIELGTVGEKHLISAKASPENTTDVITYISDDDEVASVDKNGTVVAKGSGETVIYIICGEIEIECRVVCDIEEEPIDDPTQNSDPITDPSVPDASYTKEDLTFTDNGFGYEYSIPLSQGSYNPYNGNIPAELIEFSSNDASVATVGEDGLITFVGTGRAIISAKYNDWTIECIIRVY